MNTKAPFFVINWRIVLYIIGMAYQLFKIAAVDFYSGFQSKLPQLRSRNHPYPSVTCPGSLSLPLYTSPKDLQPKCRRFSTPGKSLLFDRILSWLLDWDIFFLYSLIKRNFSRSFCFPFPNLSTASVSKILLSTDHRARWKRKGKWGVRILDATLGMYIWYNKLGGWSPERVRQLGRRGRDEKRRGKNHNFLYRHSYWSPFISPPHTRCISSRQ